MPKAETESLSAWLSLLEHRHTKEIQLGLTRIKQVAQTLDLLHPKALVITVAGTNGKGSTVALLESIYRAAGYCVASYTSPHLLLFNERIKINQQPISDAQLVSAFEVIEAAKGDILLTYFETVTLAALWYFKQHTLDIIILEVGLGGRLDATNIIDNDLAIITTIALDHMDYLGQTLDAIGFEKAGILRKNKPFIYADTFIPQTIVEKATHLANQSYWNTRDYHYKVIGKDWHFSLDKQTIVLPLSPLHGHSVGAAVMATFCLQTQLPVNHQQLSQGIQSAVLPGRFQIFRNQYTTIFDVAHNPQAADYLADCLTQYYPNATIHAVFSALADKDLIGIIAPLVSVVDYWYPALLQSARAATKQQLMSAFHANEVSVELCYNSPILAYESACQQVLVDDIIVVFGSFITVAQVLSTYS